jgi:hypothetical protein
VCRSVVSFPVAVSVIVYCFPPFCPSLFAVCMCVCRLQSEYNALLATVDALREDRRGLNERVKSLDGTNRENIVVIQTLRDQLAEALQNDTHR